MMGPSLSLAQPEPEDEDGQSQGANHAVVGTVVGWHERAR